MPPMMAAELLDEANLMSSLAEEASFDVSRASKSASYDSARKSRQRGRRSSGGRLLLRWAYGHEGIPASQLLLEEWELTRLVRTAPDAAALKPDEDSVVPESVAVTIANQLGDAHPNYSFFMTAGFHGGLTATRA